MRKLSTPLVAFLAFIFLTGFFGPEGDNPDEQRATIQKMRQDTLKDLYTFHPRRRKKSGQLDRICGVQ